MTELGSNRGRKANPGRAKPSSNSTLCQRNNSTVRTPSACSVLTGERSSQARSAPQAVLPTLPAPRPPEWLLPPIGALRGSLPGSEEGGVPFLTTLELRTAQVQLEDGGGPTTPSPLSRPPPPLGSLRLRKGLTGCKAGELQDAPRKKHRQRATGVPTPWQPHPISACRARLGGMQLPREEGQPHHSGPATCLRGAAPPVPLAPPVGVYAAPTGGFSIGVLRRKATPSLLCSLPLLLRQNVIPGSPELTAWLGLRGHDGERVSASRALSSSFYRPLHGRVTWRKGIALHNHPGRYTTRPPAEGGGVAWLLFPALLALP